MRTDDRMQTLGRIYMANGCPEKMTIHVKATGETIVLVNGMPVNILDKVTDIPCAECGRMIPEGNTRFCSPLCSGRNKAKNKRNRKAEKAHKAVETFAL
jgi:hypothetical protein